MRYTYRAGLGAEELEALGPVVNEAFDMRPDYWALFRGRLDAGDFDGVYAGGELVGGMAVYRTGQHHGGRVVPMDGPAAVAVRPDHRGAGAATTLMHGHLRDAYARGVPLSGLYPATWRVYRKSGWELAGTKQEYVLDAALLPSSPRDLPARRLRPLEDGADRALCEALYARWASCWNGTITRSRGLWDRVFRPRGKEAWTYALGPAGAEEGYVVIRHEEESKKIYDLDLLDFVALTRRAAERGWVLCADHRSMAGDVRWLGPSDDPRVWLLPERGFRVAEPERWMLRLVDVPRAFALRGYAASVRARLELEVDDPVIPENSGRWTVEIADGRAVVTAGGEGRIRGAVSGFAPLYSGFMRAEEAAWLGWVAGEGEDLAALTAALAGPMTWSADHW